MGNLLNKTQMKFALLVAAVAAQDCSVDATACAAGTCCGTATPADADAGLEAQTQCHDETATEWSDAEGNQYTFACNAAADGSARLVVGAAIAAAALYM